MTSDEFLVEQYKLLREEIMERMKQLYRTEFLGALAVAAVAAWLLRYGKEAHVPTFGWIIPPVLAAIGMLRCVHLSIRMNMIGRFLAALERELIKNNPELLGWENYKRNRPGPELFGNIVITAFWLALLAALAAISWMLSSGPIH